MSACFVFSLQHIYFFIKMWNEPCHSSFLLFFCFSVLICMMTTLPLEISFYDFAFFLSISPLLFQLSFFGLLLLKGWIDSKVSRPGKKFDFRHTAQENSWKNSEHAAIEWSCSFLQKSSFFNFVFFFFRF